MFCGPIHCTLLLLQTNMLPVHLEAFTLFSNKATSQHLLTYVCAFASTLTELTSPAVALKMFYISVGYFDK